MAKPNAILHQLGQSIWIDDITRDMLDGGTLKRYIEELSVTGLTSNPSIFQAAIANSKAYDDEIGGLLERGRAGEDLFFELAIEDLSRAAELFLPIHRRTSSVDGWVSLEVSPLLAHDTKKTITQAAELHKKANLPNLFIKIPGTPEGLPAIEEAVASGVHINVTLLFSRAHYTAAANAYMAGLERRAAAGQSLDVHSVASVFISRWDRAANDKLPGELQNKLGVAIGQQTYKAYRDLLDSDRWQRLANLGARPQRLLFGSTSMKDPKAPDTLYVKSLAAPNTVNTMPDATLQALADHGEIGAVMPRDGGDCEWVLGDIAKVGVDIPGLASQLQSDGAKAFVKSWQDLLQGIAQKSRVLA